MHAVYTVYAGAGHFKQQQFPTGPSTLLKDLNTNTLMPALCLVQAYDWGETGAHAV
jgi:hypothetical protein